jgi:hypothetical protein
MIAGELRKSIAEGLAVTNEVEIDGANPGFHGEASQGTLVFPRLSA